MTRAFNAGPSAAVSNNTQSAESTHLSGAGLFTDLPPASRHGPTNGIYTTAYTTDFGVVYSNGAAWVGLATAANTPFNPSAAGLPAGVGSDVQSAIGAVVYSINAKSAYGATGNGTTNDQAALQAAINASAASGFPCFIPQGTYRINTPLVLPTNAYLFGTGLSPDSGSGTIIKPVGCRAFTIDGGGSFVERQVVKDLCLDMSSASDATAGIYLNKCYSVKFQNFSTYGNVNAVTRALYIKDSNNIVLDTVVVYGGNPFSSNTIKGVHVDGSSVRAYHLDIEGFQATGGQALYCSGSNVWADFYSLYIETSDTNYYHDITSGQVNIFGGSLQGGPSAAQTFFVNKDNLAVYGCPFISGSAINYVTVAATPTFKNVKFNYCINEIGGTGLFASTANRASIEFYPPVTPQVNRGIVDFKKTPTSGVATALLDLSATDLIGCKLTLYGYINGGYGSVMQTFDFVVPAPTDTGDLTSLIISGTAAKVNFPVGVGTTWNLALSSPTLTVVSGKWRFGITATLSGSSGSAPISLFGKLEYMTYDPTPGNVILVL